MSRTLPTVLLVTALTAAPTAHADESPDGGGSTADVGDAVTPPDAAPEVAPIEEDHDLDRIPAEVMAPPPAHAAEDDDLDRIPVELAAPPSAALAAPPPPRQVRGKLFVEDAFTLAGPSRAIPVPYPRPIGHWQNRTSGDLYLEWSPWRPITITFSERLTVLEQDGVDFGSRQTPRNDLREAFLTWELVANTYVEAGRINLRNGAALGWNPTDFFKARTLVGQASLDPTAMRNNRLGTAMVRAQHIWSSGSLSLAFAPKLVEPSRIVDDSRYGVDPRFDATNGAHRALGTLSVDLGSFSSQLLGYYERHRAKLGANVSRTFGDAVVAYAEWAGGREQNLGARALAYAEATETLPPTPALPLPTDTRTAFRHDVAAGASWTIASKVTFNVEYHYHQAGFTRQDWQQWFDLGSSPLTPPLVTQMLWYVRGYANDQQEPMSRHQAFARAAWPRAWLAELDLSAFALVDLYHGSTLAQLAGSYYLSHHWTLGLYGSMSPGAARSERGSLPQFGSVVLQVVAYY